MAPSLLCFISEDETQLILAPISQFQLISIQPSPALSAPVRRNSDTPSVSAASFTSTALTSALVSFDMRKLSESFITNIATKWFFPCVDR